MTESLTGAHHIKIGLEEVYKQGQETREMVGDLAVQIGELVAVNRRLDSHSKSLAEHDQRLDKMEVVQAVMQTQQATLQAQEKTPLRWPAIAGGVGAILAGLSGPVAVIVFLARLTPA